jgi:acyl-CoA synthetase (AMP-forming)/AMP-acid ligase II
MDLSTHIAHLAKWTPHKAAIRFEGKAITYADFEQRILAACARLEQQGVKEGDRVAYLGPNCPELLETLYACAHLGALFVPLNARMPAAELRAFVDQTRPASLVVEQSFVDAANAIAPRLARVFPLDSRDQLVARRVQANLAGDPLRPVLLAFTSGTTERPKGALFSHQSLVLGALKMIVDCALTADDEVLVASPLFHVASLLSLALPGLCAGATLTMHRQFSSEDVLDDIQHLRVTRFMATPLMTRALATSPAWPAAELGSLRTVFTGSTFIRGADVKPWQAKGVSVVQGYGMTEAPGIALTPLGASADKVLAGGKATLFQDVGVFDASGNALLCGEAGEIWTRGPTIMLGYWENEEATRAAFHGDWFRTGDIGVVDDDGYVRVVDRMKDVIIVGTSNVYPNDLEAVLVACPEIREACVVGAPNAELGEVPVACVVPAKSADLTSERVLGLFTDRLAAYKHPRYVMFLESLPRNGLGKIQKQALRELVRAAMR